MEIIKLLRDDPAGREVAIARAVSVLKKGGVVMHETETCYGLAVDIFNKEALEKVYRMKDMDIGKPVSIMVSDRSEAEKYGVFSEMGVALAQRFWPGPLTLVVPRTGALPDFLNQESKFVGIRCPGSVLSRELVEQYGSPLTTTSANISGVRQAYEVMNFLHQMHNSKDLPDLIIDGGRLEEKPPTTILQVKGKKVEFLRQGELSYQIRAVIE